MIHDHFLATCIIFLSLVHYISNSISLFTLNIAHRYGFKTLLLDGTTYVRASRTIFDWQWCTMVSLDGRLPTPLRVCDGTHGIGWDSYVLLVFVLTTATM